MTFYLKSHLLISSATSHPILRWSHHRSRHGDAPAPPMIIVFILSTDKSCFNVSGSETTLLGSDFILLGGHGVT